MINRRIAHSLITIRRYYRSTSALLKRTCRAVISRKRSILICSISAFFLLALSYFVDSTPYPIGGEVIVGQWMERLRKLTNKDTDNVPDSICIVNVAFDKTLVDYNARLFSNDYDSPTLPAGKITATDRGKLFEFLNIADSLKNYKYILLDVRFEDDIETDSISAKLFSLIGRMDNIVFAIHENGRIADGVPLEKAAFGDYHTSFLVTDVVKYPLLKYSRFNSCDIPSIPAKMYSELNHQEFSTNGLVTFCGDKLCRRCIYPSFPVRITSWAKQSEETNLPILQYYNLGEDLINTPNNRQVISDIINDRIIVLGDFIDDIHDTYIGPQPGALINLNAYISLCKLEHFVNVWGIVFQFILFFIITWLIMMKKTIIDFFPILKKPSLGLLRFILSFVSYTFILTIAATIIYVTFNSIFSIALPSLYFTVFQSCVKN